MKCTKCGTEIGKGQAFCSKCGTPVSEMKTEESSVREGTYNEPPKKKGGVPVAVFIITILLIIGIAAGVCCFFAFRDKDSDDDVKSSSSSSKDDDDNKSSKKSSDDDDDDDDSKFSKNNTSKNNTSSNRVNTSTNTSSNTTNTTKTSTSTTTGKITVGDYSVKIPSTMEFDVSGKRLNLTDADGNWRASMEFHNRSYATIIQNKDKLTSSFQAQGITASNIQETTINGTQCLTCELSQGSEKAIAAYINIDSVSVASVVVEVSGSSASSSEALKDLVSVAKSAQKKSETSNMQTKINADMAAAIAE